MTTKGHWWPQIGKSEGSFPVLVLAIFPQLILSTTPPSFVFYDAALLVPLTVSYLFSGFSCFSVFECYCAWKISLVPLVTSTTPVISTTILGIISPISFSPVQTRLLNAKPMISCCTWIFPLLQLLLLLLFLLLYFYLTELHDFYQWLNQKLLFFFKFFQ